MLDVMLGEYKIVDVPHTVPIGSGNEKYWDFSKSVHRFYTQESRDAALIRRANNSNNYFQKGKSDGSTVYVISSFKGENSSTVTPAPSFAKYFHKY